MRVTPSFLQSRLLQNRIDCPNGKILPAHGDGDDSPFLRMEEYPMTAGLSPLHKPMLIQETHNLP